MVISTPGIPRPEPTAPIERGSQGSQTALDGQRSEQSLDLLTMMIICLPLSSKFLVMIKVGGLAKRGSTCDANKASERVGEHERMSGKRVGFEELLDDCSVVQVRNFDTSYNLPTVQSC